MKVSSKSALAAVLLGCLMLGLFYSLAFHIYHNLGHWPDSISERGFSPSLLIHSTIVTDYFILCWLAFSFLPMPIVVCISTSGGGELQFIW
jgi:hypothetical protein